MDADDEDVTPWPPLTGDVRGFDEDLEVDLQLWLAHRWPRLAVDAESIVNEVQRRCLLRYRDRVDDWRPLAFTIARRVVIDIFRREQRQRRRAPPPPGSPSERFLDFILSLGKQEAREVVRWHRGVSEEDSARLRGVQLESIKRMRRRITNKWRDHLASRDDLTAAEQQIFRDYLEGSSEA